MKSKFGGRGFIKWIQDYGSCAVKEPEFDNIPGGGSSLDRDYCIRTRGVRKVSLKEIIGISKEVCRIREERL